MTSTKRTVNPAIESRQGRMNICEPIPIRKPPTKAPAKRKICFWRDAPIVESPVSRHVVTAVLIPGGRRLLGEVERTAGEAGVVVLRLETNRALSEAIALYERSGYAEVKASTPSPTPHHWFEKTLGKKTQTGRVQ